MQDSGVAIMASGKASGENRAYDAIEETLDSPLLNKADIRGAKTYSLILRQVKMKLLWMKYLS
jgi:cell division GTPase FtsZ